VSTPAEVGRLVSSRLPPNPLRRERHRLLGHGEGLRVRTPAGAEVVFDLERDGRDASKIKTLTRRVLVPPPEPPTVAEPPSQPAAGE
jgi:hypothetical protein